MPDHHEERTRRRLLHRYAVERRASDLDALVRSYQPLAHALARRYAFGGIPDPDLEQAACEGLIKALRRYEPSRGTPFTAFAVPTIIGEVRRYLRDTTWPAHVPRSVQELVRRVRACADAHSAIHGRPPTPSELAGQLDLPEEQVVDALFAASTTSLVPLDARRGGTGEPLTLADRLGWDDPGYGQAEDLASIEQAFPALEPEQQEVLRLHFGCEMTQRQIAHELGFSRSHVGRLIGSALDRLRVEVAA